MKEHRGYWDAISFGMGHAFCEIFLIYSMTLLNNLLFCYMLNLDGLEATSALLPADQAQLVIDQFTAIQPSEVFAGLLERVSTVFSICLQRYWSSRALYSGVTGIRCMQLRPTYFLML